jgi:multicomponent Na+:H+ antiporter subunit D
MSALALLIAGLVIPFVGAVLIAITGRAPNLRETVTLATAGLLFLTVTSITPHVLAGGRPQLALFEILPGLLLGFRIEPLGMLFALVASGLWILNSIFSIGYMRANREAHQTRFYACFAGSLGATLAIAFAANLITLFLAYEALTLITYPLVTHYGDEKAKQAGRVYLGYLLTTSIVFLLIAIILTWSAAGTTDFLPGGILGDRLSKAATSGLLALFVFGIGMAALMPVHRWLPAAMVAPTPVSALLCAVAVVQAGVFTVVKVIVYVFGVENIAGLPSVGWLPIAAGLTIVLASIVALRSDNLKRRLAYSTVSHLSYVVLAAALLTPLSMVGAVFHIAAHAVGKITLFFAAGAIYTVAHKTEVSQLNGIGRRMPVTMAAFTVGALSLIGVPPAAGFVSPRYIISGAAATGQVGAIVVLIFGALSSAAYLLPIAYAAFFRSPPVEDAAHGEAPVPILIALAATALATVALFFFADVPLHLARQVAGLP